MHLLLLYFLQLYTILLANPRHPLLTANNTYRKYRPGVIKVASGLFFCYHVRIELQKAREILEKDDMYDYTNRLSKVERLVIFEAVAKRVGRHIDFYAGHDVLYIVNLDHRE